MIKPKRRRRHSLSGRLLLLFLITALLLGGVVRTGFWLGVQDSVHDLAGPHLDAYLGYLLDRIGDPPSRAAAVRLAGELPIEVHLLGPEPWSTDGTPPRRPYAHGHTGTLADGTRVLLGPGPDGFSVWAEHGERSLILVPDGPVPGTRAKLAAVATIAAVLLVLVGAYHGIRRLFSPIETIRAGVARIGAGQLGQRLDIRRRDELGELAEAINAMADDIRDMLEAKRALLLAVSHELRSPLTRARVNAELVAESPPRDALLRDLAELESLLGELLESERLRGRHASLNREAVDPSELLTSLVAERFADAGIGLDLDPPGIFLALDPVRIRILARNLLDNALRHTPADAAPPTLSSHLGDAHWTLGVRDHGEGIDPALRERVTEPFERLDPSRRRGTGGVGLGLYLSRVIAEAHSGELRIDAAPGGGTRILVRIPVDEDV